MKFHTQQFEGPLELLLSLIEERQLGITEVALSEVTQQYIAYVHEHRDEITPENIADFLSVAARLIVMKSTALLPFLVPPADEDETEEVDLVAQLELYKRMARAGTMLGEMMAGGVRCVARRVPPRKRQIVFLPPDCDAMCLQQHLHTVIRDVPTVAQLDRASLRRMVALHDRVRRLAEAVQRHGTVSFTAFVRNSADRADVIVSFLALLELVKRNELIVTQQRAAGDILLRSCDTIKQDTYE